MKTLAEALAKAGLVRQDTAEMERERAEFLQHMRLSNATLLADAEKILDRHERKQKFVKSGVRDVMRDSKRNPRVSGTMASDVRGIDAAGSDSRKKGAMSGPSVRFGWKAMRGGQQHPDEKRDYWEPKND